MNTMKISNGAKKIAISAGIVILLLAIIQFPAIAIRLKTIGVSFNLLIPVGKWRPLELLTQSPIREEHRIESTSGRALTVHVYRPKAQPKKPRTAMIIYTPFIGGGLDDPRLVNLASTFTRAGFIIAVPWRDQDRLVISAKDIDDVVSTALFITTQQELNVDALGFFGISYGAGPVIAAATDQQLRDSTRFIISFGGYYDFQHVLDFILTGRYSYQDIEKTIEPHPYGREILDATLSYYNVEAETFRAGTEFETLRQILSPSNVVQRINTEVFIAHSTDDRYIPYTESMRLAETLGERVPVTFALTTIFEHGTYKKLSIENIRRHYLPSIDDFYNFLFTLLSKHS